MCAVGAVALDFRRVETAKYSVERETDRKQSTAFDPKHVVHIVTGVF
jgi:hypothetical protein